METLARRHSHPMPDPRRPSASRWRRCSPTWRTARRIPTTCSASPSRSERRAAAFLHRACRCRRRRFGRGRAVPRTGRRGAEHASTLSPPSCSAGSRAGSGAVRRSARRRPRVRLQSSAGRSDQRRRAAAARLRCRAHRAGVRRPAAHARRAARPRRPRRRRWRRTRLWSAATAVAIGCPTGWQVVAFSARCGRAAPAVAVNPKIPAPGWHYILDEAGFTVIPRRERRRHAAALARQGRAGRRRAARGTRGQPGGAACLVDPDTPAFWVHSVGHLGQAQGGGACAPLRARGRARRASGWASRPRIACRSSRLFSYPQTNQPARAGLKLGATVVFDPQWPTAQSGSRYRRRARPTVLLRCLALPSDAARGLAAGPRGGRAAPVRIGRRSAAAEPARCLARADRAAHGRRLRRFRNPGAGAHGLRRATTA